jgi:hypothetical protein
MRMLRYWLLGLYVVAQAVGVVPLMYDHTLNIYETTPVAGHVHIHLASETGQPDADHHHGLLGFHDQCCALHSLSGPLPLVLALALAESVGNPLPPVKLIALVSWHPARLDRPPKSLPLI